MRAEEALALILRDTERSCGRSLLLSLFIASSIQQGGASEPGVQPGQAGGGGPLRSREGRGIGRDGGVVEDGARVCPWVCAGLMMRRRWRVPAQDGTG